MPGIASSISVRGAPGDGAPRGRPGGILVAATVALAGVLLFLPTLRAGFFLDDYYHVALLAGFRGVAGLGPLSLYTFADGHTERMGAVQGDFLPWWAAADLRIDFWRPLTCLLYLADYRLHGNHPQGYHATNLVLWALLLAAIAPLYQVLGRVSGRGLPLVLLAGLFYALDEAHVMTLLWVANRHALLGALFLVLALLCYHEYRVAGRIRGLILCLGCFALGLLSSELTVALGGWIIAYEACLAAGPVLRRMRAAAPVMVLLAMYLAYYKLAGHGALNSGDYVSPLTEPLGFLQAAATNVPVLLLGALTPLSPQEWPALLVRLADQPGWRGTIAGALPHGVTVGVLAGLAVLVFVPLLRRDRVARFVGLATLLSLIAQASTAAEDRHLLLPTVGTAWLLAAYVYDVVRGLHAAWRARRAAQRASPAATETSLARLKGAALWPATVLAMAILFAHAGLAPQAARANLGKLSAYAGVVRQHALDAEMPAAAQAGDARVLVLNTDGSVAGFYLPWIRLVEGQPWPAGFWLLSVIPGDPRIADQRLTRTGPRSLRLEVPRPGYVTGPWERVFRKDTDLPAGTRFRRGVLEVELTRVVDGRIVEIEVTLDRPLDDPSVWLLAWNGRKWARIPAGPLGIPRLMSEAWRF